MLLKGILSTTRPTWIKTKTGALPNVKCIKILRNYRDREANFRNPLERIRDRLVKTTSPYEREVILGEILWKYKGVEMGVTTTLIFFPC